MLERTLLTLFGSQVDEIMVVLGYSAELIQQNVSFGAAKVVINGLYREGMASSLRMGLSAVEPDAQAALIVLADQPFLKAETIDLIIEEYCREKPEIIIPTYNGVRGNPVLLDRCVFGEAAELSGDVGCRAIFDRHAEGIIKLPVQDPGILVDLDTPADVERFEQSGL